ncbi:hypothetical protein ACLKA7_001781 [Drosophila subpalustris]
MGKDWGGEDPCPRNYRSAPLREDGCSYHGGYQVSGRQWGIGACRKLPLLCEQRAVEYRVLRVFYDIPSAVVKVLFMLKTEQVCFKASMTGHLGQVEVNLPMSALYPRFQLGD